MHLTPQQSEDLELTLEELSTIRQSLTMVTILCYKHQKIYLSSSPKPDLYLVGVRDSTVVLPWAAVGWSVLVHGWCGRSFSQQAAL